MNYSVNLVQRGISSATHPVSGKSGKVYGNATHSPEHGGVEFLMSLSDYADNMHDLIGNPAANQQWVPEFVAVVSAGMVHKCDRCPQLAVARWGKYFFCLEHAPKNAEFLDGSGMVAPADKPKADAPESPDSRPELQERVSKPIEEERELSAEHLPAPPIGTNREGDPPHKSRSGVITLKEEAPPAPPPVAAPTGPRGPEAAPPEKAPDGAQTDGAQKAVQAITNGVIAAIMPKLDQIVDEKFAAIKARPSAPPKQGPKKKAAPQTRHLTQFQYLQQRAKRLGINSFGKNADKLRAEIADKAAASLIGHD